MVSVNHRGTKFRFFLGDVNDMTNLGCLYFMDQVVSVGESSYAKRVFNLYVEKKKTVTINGHKLNVNPFQNSIFKASTVSFKSHNKNAKELRFTVSRKGSNWTGQKSLTFFHLYNKQISISKDVFKILNGLKITTKKKVNNVLFVADHLEPYSLYLWKYLLTVYRKWTLETIVRVTYRRIRIFSGLLIHTHNSNYHVKAQ